MSEIATPAKNPIFDLWDVLVKRGWIGKPDLFLLLLSVAWPLVANHWLQWPLVPVLLGNILIGILWLIFLCYRIAYFAIIIQVKMDSMPATSARLAVKFLKQVPTNLPGGA